MSQLSAPNALSHDTLVAHTAWVRRLAHRLVDDPHRAEDLAQATCVAAIKTPPAHGKNLRGWFERVLRNLVRQERRHETRRVAREHRAAVPEPVPSSSELAADLQMHRRVVEVVAELAEPYQSVVLLRYFRDLPPREIARLRGAPIATVNSQLARALRRLRERLDDRHDGDRHAWCVPLAGWLAARQPLVAAGVLTMKTKGIWALAIVGLLGIWAVSRVVSVDGGAGIGQPEIDPRGAQVASLDSIEPRVVESPPPAERRGLADAAPRTAASATFRGRVVDVSGAPIGDIRVKWRDDDGESVAADPQGGFELPVPDCERDVVVADELRTTVLLARVGPGVRRYDGEPVVVTAPRLEFAGRVVDDAGAPLADVTVLCAVPSDFHTRLPLTLEASQQVPWEASTVDDGSFALSDVGRVPGAYLMARKAGYLPSRIDQPDRSDQQLRLTLVRPKPAPGNLQGQVIDAVGTPVPAAHVAVGRAATIADADGMFVLPLQRAFGRREVIAMARGYLPATHSMAEDGGGEHEFVYLRLGAKPRTIAGVVVDAHGAPVEGARVWAEAPAVFGVLEQNYATVEGYLAGGLSRSEVRRERDRDDGWQRTPSALWGFVETDSHGRFELGGLLDKPYELGALLPGSLARTVAGPFASGSTDARIEFPRDAVLPRVAGTVVGRDGTPIVGVSVRAEVWPMMVHYQDGRADIYTGVPQSVKSVETDAEGRFELRDVGTWTMLGFTGDAILSESYGDWNADIRDGPWPVEALRVVVSRRMRIRVELADPSRADEFRAYTRDGEQRRLHKFSGPFQGQLDAVNLQNGKSEVCSVPEDVVEIVLFKDGEEISRLPVTLTAGEITVVTG